jgi:Asp-tRNA(Asn)/Glu-tRNA(Gln) amidotransferase B subunit
MRVKSDSIDYHYFPEPNITSIDILPIIKNTIFLQSPSQIKNELLSLSIPENNVDQLINNYDAYKAFDYLFKKNNNFGAIIT